MTITRTAAVLFCLAAAWSAAAADDWHSGTYRFDPSGNIKAIGADAYAYDAVNRVVGATLDAYGKSQGYRYDAFGNLIELGGKPLDVSDINNRLSVWTYDAVGNVTYDPTVEGRPRTYHYDALGMVTAIDDVSDDRRMIYTADEERIVLSVGPNTSYRIRDFNNRLLREWRISSGMLVWDRDYVYAENQLVAGHVQVDSRNNPVRHYHPDHLGSIRMVSDGTGQTIMRHDYWPFGEEESPTTQEYQNTGHIRDPLKFTSHERDYFSLANVESDDYVDYMHARYYGTGAGRFMAVDPFLDLKKTVATPQAWNRYAYAANNPVRNLDPDGRATQPMEAVARYADKVEAMTGAWYLPVLTAGMSLGINNTAGLVSRIARLGDGPGEAIGSGASGGRITWAITKDAFTVAEVAFIVNGAVAPFRKGVSVIGEMKLIDAFMKSNPGANRMFIPWDKWEAMTKAQQIAAVAKFAAGIGLRGDYLVRLKGNRWTQFEVFVIRLVQSAAGGTSAVHNAVDEKEKKDKQ